jgi:glycosyltransferase involved in cell wall biosynthesis
MSSTTAPIERPRISACIIAFNEAGRIGDCLASLAFCDEIVVVDSYSTDATVAIAEAAGARVLQRRSTASAARRPTASSRPATTGCCAWTPMSGSARNCARPSNRPATRLRRPCRLPLRAPVGVLRQVPAPWQRLPGPGDAPVRPPPGGWRGKREIHEAASVDGSVGTLRGDLIHYPYRSLQQQLAKTEKYARMMAEHEFARGKRATLGKLVLAPAWRFWRGFVFRGGFRDGWHGLVYAYVRANYVRQKTIMLWMLGNGQPWPTRRTLIAGARRRADASRAGDARWRAPSTIDRPVSRPTRVT